jgi:hypothetical protein
LEHRYEFYCIMQVPSRRFLHRLVGSKHVQFREKPNFVVRESTAKNVMLCGLLLIPAAADIPASMAYLELFH